MRLTWTLALGATLLLAGGAAALGEHATGFVTSTAATDPASLAPGANPAPGAMAPWFAAWDPLGKAGTRAASAKAAAELEKTAGIAAANGGAALAAGTATGAANGESGDARALLAFALDGSSSGTGANDLLAAHAWGFGVPSSALPPTSAPAVGTPSVPNPSFARPTGALAAFAPPSLGLGAAHPGAADLDASLTAATAWGATSQGWTLARAGEAAADATTFAGTANGYATALAGEAAATASGIAALAG